MMRYIITGIAAVALVVAAVGLYLDYKPKEAKAEWQAPWTIRGIHCAVYQDCDNR